MSRNNYFSIEINNLRVLLNCFYAYLVSTTFQYTKHVIFQSTNSISSIHLKIYLSIRSLISTFCITIYSILIIYSLWFERVGILSISLLLLFILFIIRFLFDLYYYYHLGSFENSLDSSFEFLRMNLTQINKTMTKEKQMNEEITDFIMELIINMIGILLTVFIISRMLRTKRVKRQMELEALSNDLIRRMTV
ncbi:hypothetical protein I4U23_002388 [Adineta vaga]|nr:hypothetical protein I4U23_002388 [Adineta vaga]